jgi:conjugal transfer pilus assembly protein TraE
MNYEIEKNRINYLLSQRNTLLGLTGSLLLVLLFVTPLLFFKTERVIVLPADVKQSFWVEGNQFSDSYLEEMATFYAHLLLDVTQEYFEVNGKMVLRAVAPESYSTVKTKLLKGIEKMKNENASTLFMPQKALVYGDKLEVHLEGLMRHFIGGKEISSYVEKFKICFSGHKGRLFINSFSLLETQNNKLTENVEG